MIVRVQWQLAKCMLWATTVVKPLLKGQWPTKWGVDEDGILAFSYMCCVNEIESRWTRIQSTVCILNRTYDVTLLVIILNLHNVTILVMVLKLHRYFLDMVAAYPSVIRSLFHRILFSVLLFNIENIRTDCK